MYFKVNENLYFNIIEISDPSIIHNPRINPAMTGFNVGCVDEINTFEMKDIPVNDGQNHPLDKK